VYDACGEQISLPMQALGAGAWTTKEAQDCKGCRLGICAQAQLVMVLFGVAVGEMLKLMENWRHCPG
jgi:hypothetical protein